MWAKLQIKGDFQGMSPEDSNTERKALPKSDRREGSIDLFFYLLADFLFMCCVLHSRLFTGFVIYPLLGGVLKNYHLLLVKNG